MSAAEVESWVARMATGGDLEPLAELTPAQLCDVLTQLELLKNASAAAQARVTVVAHTALRDQALADGVPDERADRGITQQLAMARRQSPHAGSRHVGLAHAVVFEMPATHAALTAGLISEWTATQLVKETACLSVEHRRQVDAHLAGRFGADSHRALVAAAKAKAYELDPYSVTTRGRKARSDRRVSVRPAPDVMAIVSGYLPVADGVACYHALDQAAKSLKAQGDERSLDQLRADLFADRLIGRGPAEGTHIEVGLVMTDKALVGLEETPARLEGYGPIPAPMARDLVHPDGSDGPHGVGPPDHLGAEASDPATERVRREAEVWVRRLYADPTTGILINQDDRRRTFTGPLRRLIVARDQVCRTPWCDAPVRHADHILAFSRGGRTNRANGDGLCEACNYVKETEGLSHEVVDLADGSHTIKITTPTGHTYYSRPPPVLPTLGDQAPSEPTAEPGSGAPSESTHSADPSCAMRRDRVRGVTTIRLRTSAEDRVGRSAPSRRAARAQALVPAESCSEPRRWGRDHCADGLDPLERHLAPVGTHLGPLERYLAGLLDQAA